jgi:hypothetical protein
MLTVTRFLFGKDYFPLTLTLFPIGGEGMQFHDQAVVILVKKQLSVPTC